MKLSSGVLLAALASSAIYSASGESFVPVGTEIEDTFYELPNPSMLDGNGNLINDEDFENDSLEASYSAGTAISMVRFAAATYCTRVNGSLISNWSCKVCRAIPRLTEPTVFHIAKHDTYGYVGFDRSNNRVVVAYAGTNPLSYKNVFTDLNTFSVGYRGCGGCQAHAGFYNAYVDSRSQVVNLIQQKKSKFGNGNTRVAITGHSLGGALAAHLIADLSNSVFGFVQNEDGTQELFGSNNNSYEIPTSVIEASIESNTDLVSEYPVDAELLFEKKSEKALLQGEDMIQARFNVEFPAYTFGQPRIGNGNLANWYKSRVGQVFRVTHNRDPVPHLPPLAFGYSHPTSEVFYNQPQTSYKVCSQPEDKSCSNQFAFIMNFSDHVNYLQFPISDHKSNC